MTETPQDKHIDPVAQATIDHITEKLVEKRDQILSGQVHKSPLLGPDRAVLVSDKFAPIAVDCTEYRDTGRKNLEAGVADVTAVAVNTSLLLANTTADQVDLSKLREAVKPDFVEGLDAACRVRPDKPTGP